MSTLDRTTSASRRKKNRSLRGHRPQFSIDEYMFPSSSKQKMRNLEITELAEEIEKSDESKKFFKSYATSLVRGKIMMSMNNFSGFIKDFGLVQREAECEIAFAREGKQLCFPKFCRVLVQIAESVVPQLTLRESWGKFRTEILLPVQ